MKHTGGGSAESACSSCLVLFTIFYGNENTLRMKSFGVVNKNWEKNKEKRTYFAL